MLEIRGLCTAYGERQILKGMDLRIPEGKLTVLLGPNGCGKSTLLKALCGIVPVTGGRILLDGRDLLAMRPQELAQRIAYLAQSRQLPDITAYRLVLHGRFPYLGYPRRYRREDHVIARAAMEKMGVWEHADTRLEELSGGERQRVYIAMALAQETPVVLLDEPTTYLDICHQLQLLRQAGQLARQGKTVLMVLHDLPHAFQTAEHMVLMFDGRAEAEGSPENLYTSGCVERIFRVRLGRTRTDSGWRYFCEGEDV